MACFASGSKSSSQALSVLVIVCLALVSFGVATSVSSASSPSARLSPSADAQPPSSKRPDIICHTDNSAECYPRVFEATHEFQKVHDDQDLPPGLHVRLNIWTGEKEAKINVPDEEVDSAVMIIDPEQQPSDYDQQQAPLKPPSNAPAYDPAGTIKEPPRDDPSAVTFHRSLAILRKGMDVDGALEMLEDVSHDIYYGLKIAEDYDTVRQLFCLAAGGSDAGPSDAVDAASPSATLAAKRARLAALTIGSTVQNNPKALAEISRHWPKLRKEKCPLSAAPRLGGEGEKDDELGTATFCLVSRPVTGSSQGGPAGLAKVRAAAISGLLKSPVIRADFLAGGGMDLLLDVLLSGGGGAGQRGAHDDDSDAWAPARRKVGLLVLDNFLDESMGAALGEWPVGATVADEECARRDEQDEGGGRGGGRGGGKSAGCWDWHAEKLAERFKTHDGHWSRDLYRMIKEQRKANNNRGRRRSEL